MPGAYYNEHDADAAAWLRELIRRGLIAPGEIDTRSIEDVHPYELTGFTQCHFFAGIGGWSLALRLAGWPDELPVWTGSCPCQPFSAAGAGAGEADERHLWPAWFHLLGECRPPAVFGEQVASKAALGWFDLVQADMEGAGYAVAGADFCAASVGAPHRRQRIYWGAFNRSVSVHLPERTRSLMVDDHHRRGGAGRFGRLGLGVGGRRDGANLPTTIEDAGEARRMADDHGDRREPQPDHGPARLLCQTPREEGFKHEPRDYDAGLLSGLSDAFNGPYLGCLARAGERLVKAGHERLRAGILRTRPTNGFWRAADWLRCRDGRWRPVEPGSFPLAHGVPARVVRLRGYGNAIVPQQGAAFVEAMVESLPTILS